jgi:hypothetical protein
MSECGSDSVPSRGGFAALYWRCVVCERVGVGRSAHGVGDAGGKCPVASSSTTVQPGMDGAERTQRPFDKRFYTVQSIQHLTDSQFNYGAYLESQWKNTLTLTVMFSVNWRKRHHLSRCRGGWDGGFGVWDSEAQH